MSPYTIALFLTSILLSIHWTTAQGEANLQTNPGVVIPNAVEGRMVEGPAEAAELLRSKRWIWGYPYGWGRPWGYYPWGFYRPYYRVYEYYPWLKA